VSNLFALLDQLFHQRKRGVRCGVMEGPGLKPGLELRVCRPSGVGATMREY
jgi:hypothetical protein